MGSVTGARLAELVRATSRRGEQGYTLVELLVALAIVTILGAVAVRSLVIEPASVHASALEFESMLNATRVLASALAGDPDAADGSTLMLKSGATLAISQDGDRTVLTVYRHRPMRNATLERDDEMAQTFLDGTVALHEPNSSLATPPFGIFIAPSGRVALQATWRAGEQLDAQPPCGSPTQTYFTLVFSRRTYAERYRVSCVDSRFTRE
jgi:prepilin-type N-terminal cleavage/methylation domain-containing protein